MFVFLVLIQMRFLLRAAAHLVDILVKRLSCQLDSFRHGWKDMDRINNVVYGEFVNGGGRSRRRQGQRDRGKQSYRRSVRETHRK